MSISLGHHECDVLVTARIRVGNLKRFFDAEAFRNSAHDTREFRLVTEKFGPGWTMSMSRNVSTDGEDAHMALYLNAPNIVSKSLQCTVIAASRDGTCWRTASFTHVCEPGGGMRRGWPMFIPKKYWDNSPELRQENMLWLTVTVKTPPGPSPNSEPTLALLHRSITEDETRNVMFSTFSKRSDAGILTSPRKLVADYDLLMTHCGGWEKSGVVYNVEQSAAAVVSFETDYMQADSDFEQDYDAEDEEINEEEGTREHDIRTDSNVHMKEEQAEDTVSAHDAVLVSEKDAYMHAAHAQDSVYTSTVSTLWDTSTVSTLDTPDAIQVDVVNPSDATMQDVYRTNADNSREPSTESPSSIEKAACQTASRNYTMGSIVVGAASATSYMPDNPYMPAPCSCKSMYRLADELDMFELRDLALTHLQSRLSKDTILTEIFSEFTSRYKEVKKVEMEVLLRYWSELVDTQVLRQKLVEMASGDYPHAGDIVAEIFKQISQGRVGP